MVAAWASAGVLAEAQEERAADPEVRGCSAEAADRNQGDRGLPIPIPHSVHTEPGVMDMESRRKQGFMSLRIAIVIAIIVASIGLGPRGVKYVLRYSAGKQEPEATTISGEGAKTGIIPSSSSIQLNRPLSDYQLIVEKNLLRPLGWQRARETPARPEPVIQREKPYKRPGPPNHLTLTGITHLSEEPMALIEDVSKGEAYFLREGDRLKNYVVANIEEDNIILVNGASRITAALGTRTYYNSNGGLLSTGSTESQTTGSIMKDSSKQPASSDGDTADMSIIERMRARRRKELGQK